MIFLYIGQPPPSYSKDGLDIGIYVPKILTASGKNVELTEDLCSVVVVEGDRVFMMGNLDKLGWEYFRGNINEETFYSELRKEINERKKDCS